MNCLHKLRFARKSRSESVLVRDNNVVDAEMIPHVAKDTICSITLHRIQVKDIGL